MTILEELKLAEQAMTRSDAELLEVLAAEVRLNGARSEITGEYSVLAIFAITTGMGVRRLPGPTKNQAIATG